MPFRRIGAKLLVKEENGPMSLKLNREVGGKLDETARLLTEQEANPFRAEAYRRAATTVRNLDRSVADILEKQGAAGLQQLPGVGKGLAASIREYVENGRMSTLERLRGERDPVRLLQSVPGIGAALVTRLYEDLGIETLEELEVAAHDGRLENVAGMGAKRLAGIRDSLAHRLRPSRIKAPPPATPEPPPVSELLDVDEEYRRKAAANELKKIAPRRFNPRGVAWLPVLHTRRGERHYTALFSNTARAHELGKTHDWVVLYYDDGPGERQYTVVTAERGPLRGSRVVRGRETESMELTPRPVGS
jgi:DNA polymerase (family X)